MWEIGKGQKGQKGQKEGRVTLWSDQDLMVEGIE
jgi:hypothetical protein